MNPKRVLRFFLKSKVNFKPKECTLRGDLSDQPKSGTLNSLRTKIRRKNTDKQFSSKKVLILSLSLRKASYQRIHLMEQPIYLFPCPLWVNLQCSAIFSPVASRNYGCFIRLDTRVPPVIDPTAMPCLWALIRAKQQSMAATAWVIWLCACVRYWPGRGMVNVCPLLYVCKIEATVSFISTY